MTNLGQMRLLDHSIRFSDSVLKGKSSGLLGKKKKKTEVLLLSV